MSAELEFFKLIEDDEKLENYNEVNKQKYCISKELYNKIINNKYFKSLQNWYSFALEAGYYDKKCHLSEALYHLWWTVIKYSENSIEDIKLIDLIYKANRSSGELSEPVEKDEQVLKILKDYNYSSFIEFKNYIRNRYGFNIEEYINMRFYKHHSPKKSIWEKDDNKQEAIIDYFSLQRDLSNESDKKLNENYKDNLYSCDNSLKDISSCAKKLKNISYNQKYNYPKIDILETNSVTFTFNLLDNNIDEIIKEIKDIYKTEKYKRHYILPKYFDDLFFSKEKIYGSVKNLAKSSVYYKYKFLIQEITKKITKEITEKIIKETNQEKIKELKKELKKERNKDIEQERARILYNLHVFHKHFEDSKSDGEVFSLTHKNFITYNTMKKEVRKTNKIVQDLMNLN